MSNEIREPNRHPPKWYAERVYAITNVDDYRYTSLRQNSLIHSQIRRIGVCSYDSASQERFAATGRNRVLTQVECCQ